GEKNTTEELYKFSDAELVSELYLQNLVFHGLEQFLFRFYVTLLGVAKGGRVIRHISQIFGPLQTRVEEVRLQFQASFATEREKMRLRPQFQEYYKEQEQRSQAEMDGERGPIRFSNRLVDQMALARGGKLSQAQSHAWAEALKTNVLAQLDSE